MDVLRNNEEKILCPYNASHHIRRYRMEVHLTKCRKSFKESENLVECDFNACHRIPERELQYHHDICPDRKGVELQIFTEEDIPTPPIVPKPHMPVPVDDSWDDVDVPSYNPQKYCEENNILRRLDTESAAKRRNFRTAERHRMNNLDPATNTAPRKNVTSSQPLQENSKKTLPPIPSFSTQIEQPPEHVTEMLEKLSIRPKRAVIPKLNK